tara:strand:- start:1808 stop:3106 length:1299 start_codon:yes stop_codon:yes gene_type:complete
MKVVAFLPAKGSSSRVHNKNTRIFNGEPFFAFTLKKLLQCDFIDEVYIDSEDEGILSVGKRLGAKVMRRDAKLASNATDGNRLFMNEVMQVEADIYIQALCTSPFVKIETIRTAVETLKSNAAYDSVVLGRNDKFYEWINGSPSYDIQNIPNSVDMAERHIEAMSLYVIRADAARRTQRRIGDRPKMIFGDSTELIDVNTPEEFFLAEKVAAGILAEENRRLKLLGIFLSSPVLSDICDEFGIHSVLSRQFACNLPHQRVIGRARTLEIRPTREGESETGIYDALQSYKLVASNDIMVIKNQLPEYAYFGELNMSLAVRSGAVAALIDGVTRDSAATMRANFPVFSKGTYCKDIKGRGTLQSMNEPVEIDGVRIDPSSLIFADQDGVVVIPPAYESRILRRAVDVLVTEKNILADICSDVEIDSLVERNGFF